MLKCVIFMMILVVFFSIYKNREVARCFHGYRNYAPHSDITRYQNLCTIPSSSRICIQIPLAYPALPNPLSRPLFPFCLSTIKGTNTQHSGHMGHFKTELTIEMYFKSLVSRLEQRCRNRPGPGPNLRSMPR